MIAEPTFLKSLAKAYQKAERDKNARDAYLAAAKLDASDWESLKRAAEITENDLAQPAMARIYLQDSLRRNPAQPDLIEELHGKAARKRYEAHVERVTKEHIEPHLPQLTGNLHPTLGLTPQGGPER